MGQEKQNKGHSLNPKNLKLGSNGSFTSFFYLPGAPKPLIGWDLLEKLAAEIKVKEGEIEVLIPESK